MQQDAKKLLADELARLVVADEQAWLEYVPLASRLAALGEPHPLARWGELARPFASRLDQVLIERSEEGTWDLEQSVGSDLALAMIDAQDFYCFLRRERTILPPLARRKLEAWAEAAERTPLDEEAAFTLRRFLRRFPLPLEDRLRVMLVPQSFMEEAILAALARPCPVVELNWPPSPAAASALAEIGQLDAGQPSDRLKRSFERLDVPVEIPSVGRFTLSRRVDDQWRVVIDFEKDDGTAPEIEMVRLGLIPGRRRRDDPPGRWLIDLRPWEHLQRVSLMDSPLVIGFHNGLRLQVK